MESSKNDVSVQTPFCAVFELFSGARGIAEEACLWCEQVNDLLLRA